MERTDSLKKEEIRLYIMGKNKNQYLGKLLEENAKKTRKIF